VMPQRIRVVKRTRRAIGERPLRSSGEYHDT